MNKIFAAYKDQLSWGKLTLFSFVLVSILGVMMRYKIAFSMPWIDQKNLQHAHSHFAFSGWVTLALMLLMAHFLKHVIKSSIAKYRKILISQILVSYGMLISFSVSGYGTISIMLSTISIIVFIWFAVLFYNDTKSNHHQSIKWYYASLILGIIATFGTLSLAYTKATHNTDLHTYLASLYYYLHFQYNGWFFFSIIGSLIYYLTQVKNIKIDDNKIFLGFALSIAPAYGLSVLWLNLPIYLYVLVVVAAVVQLLALFELVKPIWMSRSKIGY